jgi:hypothetical protein
MQAYEFDTDDNILESLFRVKFRTSREEKRGESVVGAWHLQELSSNPTESNIGVISLQIECEYLV